MRFAARGKAHGLIKGVASSIVGAKLIKIKTTTTTTTEAIDWLHDCSAAVVVVVVANDWNDIFLMVLVAVRPRLSAMRLFFF